MAARNPTPIGEKFNRLTVISEAPKYQTNHNRRVFAKCECGTVKHYVLSEVIHGKTKSCGCIHLEGEAHRKHGHTKGRKNSPEYHSWASMMTRCKNKKELWLFVLWRSRNNRMRKME